MLAQAMLNEQVMTQFAQSWPQVSQRLKALDAEFDPANVAGLIDQLSTMAQHDGPNSPRDKAVAVEGYADLESWAGQATVIIRAAQWAQNPPDLSDIKPAIEEINTDQQRTQADKTSAIADLELALAQALKTKPNPADIALAARFLPLLKPILEPNP